MAQVEERRKKKKGRSFLQQAKKFGRQGQRGRGTNLAQDEYDYLVRVMERWRDGFDSSQDGQDEKKVFVENVFRQMEEGGGAGLRDLAGNQLASRVIEMLMPSAAPQILRRLSEALGTDLRLICLDPFASHVLEKLLLLVCFSRPAQVGANSEDKDDDNWRLPWAQKVCKFLTNNFSDFCSDTYASYLLRTCVECVSGTRIVAESRQKQTPDEYADFTSFRFFNVSEFEEILTTFADKIADTESDPTSLFSQSESASSVVQVFLRAASARHRKPVKAVLKFLLERVFNIGTEDDSAENDETGASFSVHLDDPSLVRLMEATVEVSSAYPKFANKLFNSVFKNRVSELALHHGGNYVLQRLLSSMVSEEQLQAVLKEMEGHMEDVLSKGFTGVLLAVVKAARRLGKEQKSVVEQLEAAFHCPDTCQDLASACLKMVTKEKLPEAQNIHLHGSLIVQELLQFNKPIKVVRSLLAIPAPELRRILADPKGCHVSTSFMTSPSVGEKSREALIRQLSGELTALTCSKHGSRSMDALWNNSGLKMKQVIVEELSGKETQINGDRFGKFFARTCALSVWKHHRDEWKKVITKSDKDMELFKDILGDVSKEAQKRKSIPESLDEKPAKLSKTEDMTSDVKVSKADSESTEEAPVSSSDKKLKKKKKHSSYLNDL